MSSDHDAPPPIPPAEMPEEELTRIVDEGNVREVERALREQAVRLPRVLEQLDRVLLKGLGNLATSMATMLIARFHVARADTLAERVLEHQERYGRCHVPQYRNGRAEPVPSRKAAHNCFGTSRHLIVGLADEEADFIA